jgi:hypothetical protein
LSFDVDIRHGAILSKLIDEAMETYIYDPLAKNEIRLLEILVGPKPDLIHCRIIHTSLDHPLEYDALSYVWGGPTRTEIIFVDGRPLEVTSNLFTALQYLQPGFLESVPEYTDGGRPAQEERDQRPSTYLWVDAVCINQDDFAERNSQVGIMGLIYEGAARVIVWLGLGGDGNDEAFNLLKKLARLNGKPKELLRYDPSELTLSQITSFRMFTRNPWFNRIWVVQEVVMSLNETIFRRGRQSLKFEELDSAVSTLCKPLYPPGMDEARVRNTPGATEAMRSYTDHVYKWSKLVKVLSTTYVSKWADELKILSVLQGRRRQIGAGMDLEYLLCHLTDRGATDHRDMVYALLGMCKAPKASIPIGPDNFIGFEEPKLVVDYEATLHDVYTSVVEAVACRTRKLDIIYTIHPEVSDEWPSWVPVVRYPSSPLLLTSSICLLSYPILIFNFFVF